MNVLVDTSVWSLALRRSDGSQGLEADELQRLITDLRVRIIGPIRQEILSGIRHSDQFKQLRDTLRAFPDLTIETADFERAAEFFNICRQNGVQGSNTDFLICAVAERHELSIFTTDRDFDHFRDFLPITLFEIES